MLELSNAVDEARATVQCNLITCGRWRRIWANLVIKLADSYEANDETTANAIVLMDRYLAATICSQERPNAFNPISCEDGALEYAKCIAAACFVLATKMKDTSFPCIQQLASVSGLHDLASEIRCIESAVLTATDWDLYVPTGES